jgi:putative PIN family toxin of toxin-antitoxin system
MRLVLDTNVVASGLLWDGTPARLIDAAQANEVELFTSRVLLAELTRILRRAKFTKAIAASGASLEELVLGYAELATLVTPVPIPPTVLDDPDDDHVLACALAGNAEHIVSGDRDLLSLKTFRDIPIITPAEAMRIIAAAWPDQHRQA